MQTVQRPEPCKCLNTHRGSQTFQDQTLQPVLLPFQCLVHEEEDKELWRPWHVTAPSLWVTMVESLCCPPAPDSFIHFTLGQKIRRRLLEEGHHWKTRASHRSLRRASHSMGSLGPHSSQSTLCPVWSCVFAFPLSRSACGDP